MWSQRKNPSQPAASASAASWASRRGSASSSNGATKIARREGMAGNLPEALEQERALGLGPGERERGAIRRRRFLVAAEAAEQIALDRGQVAVAVQPAVALELVHERQAGLRSVDHR